MTASFEARKRKSKIMNCRGRPNGIKARKEATSDIPQKLQGRSGTHDLNRQSRPLSNINDIVLAMTRKTSKFGLRKNLTNFPLGIDVATICSGTEAPLLFLQMLRKGKISQGLLFINVLLIFHSFKKVL